MTICVTGATGFFGAEIVRELLRLEGCSVVALGRNEARIEQLQSSFDVQPGRLGFEVADIVELEAVPRGTSVIVHAAAERPPAAGSDITGMARVNVEGTRRLLDLGVQAGCERFLYVSTQAVYGRTGAPWSEDAPCAPETPYASTKYEGERAALEYAESLQITIVRPSRLYGVTPFTRWSELPGLFARRVVDGEPLPIFGSGEQRYDLLHVSDAACLIARAIQADSTESGRVFNVGGGGSISVNEMAETTRRLAAARGLPPVRLDRYPDRGSRSPEHLELDISRAKRELNWAPRVTVEEGFAEYIDVLMRDRQGRSANR